MGLVGIVVEFLRTTLEGSVPVTDVKIDEGGEDNATAELYQPSGFDGNPLPDDFVIAMRVPGQDRFVVVGYLDPVNEPTTEPGETRIYSRDADGNILCTIKLDKDGFTNLGEDVAAALIARADRTDAELEKLKSAHNTHTHAGLLGGMGSAAALTSGPTSTPAGTPPDFQYDPEPVGCDKVKGT